MKATFYILGFAYLFGSLAANSLDIDENDELEKLLSRLDSSSFSDNEEKVNDNDIIITFPPVYPTFYPKPTTTTPESTVSTSTTTRRPRPTPPRPTPPPRPSTTTSTTTTTTRRPWPTPPRPTLPPRPSTTTSTTTTTTRRPRPTPPRPTPPPRPSTSTTRRPRPTPPRPTPPPRPSTSTTRRPRPTPPRPTPPPRPTSRPPTYPLKPEMGNPQVFKNLFDSQAPLAGRLYNFVQNYKGRQDTHQRNEIEYNIKFMKSLSRLLEDEE